MTRHADSMSAADYTAITCLPNPVRGLCPSDARQVFDLPAATFFLLRVSDLPRSSRLRPEVVVQFGYHDAEARTK